MTMEASKTTCARAGSLIIGDRSIRLTDSLRDMLAALFEKVTGGEESTELSILRIAFPDLFLRDMEDPEAHEEHLEGDCDVPSEIDILTDERIGLVYFGRLEYLEARRLLEGLEELLLELASRDRSPKMESVTVVHLVISQLCDSGEGNGNVTTQWLVRRTAELVHAYEQMEPLRVLLLGVDDPALADETASNDLLQIKLSEDDRQSLIAFLNHSLEMPDMTHTERRTLLEALLCLLSKDAR